MKNILFFRSFEHCFEYDKNAKLKFMNIKFHYPFSKIYSLSFRLFFVCLIVPSKKEYITKTKLWHIIPTLQLTIKQYKKICTFDIIGFVFCSFQQPLIIFYNTDNLEDGKKELIQIDSTFAKHNIRFTQ